MGGPHAKLTPEQGADTGVFLATETGIQNGSFWSDRKEIEW
jgi:hypothetical protein